MSFTALTPRNIGISRRARFSSAARAGPIYRSAYHRPRSNVMDLHFDAIYENGVLRPLGPVPLPDRSKVSVTVALPGTNGKGVNGCIGTLSPDAAAEMRQIIEREFERVDPRDW